MSYSVSPALYEEAAAQLAHAIGAENYFSGTVAFRFAETDCRLTVSVIVYRERRDRPEGVQHAIKDLVPVWWEFHTFGERGEIVNDFSFRTMKEYI